MAATPRFGSEGIAFLRALAAHNDREWFRERKDVYLRDVRGPMLAVVEQLSRDFRSLEPHLDATPQSIFRPYRDTRFSEDKTPLKTNIAASVSWRGLGRTTGAGCYLSVSGTVVRVGGGLYLPGAPQLAAIRARIAEHPRTLRALLAAAGFVETFGALQGAQLQRVPRGYPSDHPAADLLRLKQFLAVVEWPAAVATDPDFYPRILAVYTALMPLLRFLNAPLTGR